MTQIELSKTIGKKLGVVLNVQSADVNVEKLLLLLVHIRNHISELLGVMVLLVLGVEAKSVQNQGLIVLSKCKLLAKRNFLFHVSNHGQAGKGNVCLEQLHLSVDFLDEIFTTLKNCER